LRRTDSRCGISMTEHKILVGTVGYTTAKRYVNTAVDVVELTEGRQIPPKKATAKRLREDTPGTVIFTAQMSRFLTDAPDPGITLPGDINAYGDFKVTKENIKLWAKNAAFARAAEAETLVLITPSSFTPSPVNLKKMETFLVEVDRDKLDVVWEPHGPWEAEQASEFAAVNGLILAVDPLRDDPPAGVTAYFRLGPFASMGSRMGVYDLERIADNISMFKKVYCLFDTTRSLDDARNLKKILAGEDLEEFI